MKECRHEDFDLDQYDVFIPGHVIRNKNISNNLKYFYGILVSMSRSLSSLSTNLEISEKAGITERAVIRNINLLREEGLILTFIENNNFRTIVLL